MGGELLDTAVRHLTAAGLEVTRADSGLRIAGPAGAELYRVEVRSRVAAGTAAALRGGHHGRILIVTGYVPEPVAESWRREDISFVDAAGNMYLRGRGILVDIRGHRRPAAPQPAQPGKPLRAFQPSGLKILFALLADPQLVGATYRDVAAATGTSLGTVQWVLKELEETGYLSPDPGARRLHRVRELFQRWVEAYPLYLHPRLLLARFDAPDPDWWRGADDALREVGAQWGGETAAHHLYRRLRPGRAVVYAREVPRRLALDFQLRKAEGEGDVEIRQRFWRLPDEQPGLTVPSPLVYADLIASAEPRQLEAAAHLREQDALLRRLDRG
jgi:hypothetical protein